MSAIVIPCASRKRSMVAAALRAVDLPRSDQDVTSEEWLARLKAASPQCAAEILYMGRGFALGRGAALDAGVPLYVVSAGLGLVEGGCAIPSYGLTVGGRGGDAIGPRVSGRFDARAWWRSVANGPFSSTWASVLHGDGLVLIAMSQAYGGMIADDLAALDEIDRRRLRIFGAGLNRTLPASLLACVMPYDARLDAIVPGTRTDFAQRAMAHFAGSIARSGDAVVDAACVARALSRHRAPVRVERPRMDDETLVIAIRRHLASTTGIGRVLRRLREQDGVACEQRRFTRLYRTALQAGAAR